MFLKIISWVVLKPTGPTINVCHRCALFGFIQIALISLIVKSHVCLLFYIDNWGADLQLVFLVLIGIARFSHVFHSSFSIIDFKFNRFCRLYRIMRELKNPKWYLYWEVNPGTSDTSDFQGLHATPQLIAICAGSLSSLDPYVVILYWSQKCLSSRIKRAWPHKDLKSWDFQPIREWAEG